MKKYLFKKIYDNLVKKERVYGIWTKTTLFTPPLPLFCLAEQRPLHTPGAKNIEDPVPWNSKSKNFHPRKKKTLAFLTLS